MPTNLDLAAWGVFGVCVQALAQGCRQKPLNYRPSGYLFSAVAFMGVGWALDGVRRRQREFLDQRVRLLQLEREARGVAFDRRA